MTEYHNPENVPESKIPEGCRFLTSEEAQNDYMDGVGLWWPASSVHDGFFGHFCHDSIYNQYTYIIKK